MVPKRRDLLPPQVKRAPGLGYYISIDKSLRPCPPLDGATYVDIDSPLALQAVVTLRIGYFFFRRCVFPTLRLSSR